MAIVKYDVSNVEDVADGVPAPVGTYRAKVRSVDGPKQSSGGNPMLEVVFDLTHDAAGKKLKESYSPCWYYPILEHDHPFVQGRLKEFLLAFGLKPKGSLDTDKIVGKSVQLKLKSDTDQNGDYRPKIAKVMALADQEEPEPEDEDEPDEADAEDEAAEDEDDDATAEADDDDGEDEDEDYSTWAIADLKAELKERELSVSGPKSKLVARLEEDDANPF